MVVLALLLIMALFSHRGFSDWQDRSSPLAPTTSL